MLSTILIKPTDELPSLEEIAALSDRNFDNAFDDAKNIIQAIIDNKSNILQDSDDLEN